ncbi:MAG: MaoC/PaaZ C-terminal domain-containing protein [Thermoproteus sp.]|nr:MaoC/PaaZ C-terminal domain-containing protein [Thermoproteus uzoniensis]
MGLAFEDFEVGARFRSHGVTVTEAHVSAFAWLTGDWNPLHVDGEFAKSTIFGERIAHGMLTASLALGLFAQYLYGTVIALLEASARFLKPVKIGDTIYVETEVVDKRPSEKYRGGVVHLRHEVKNQRGETAAVVETKVLVAGRWRGST